MAITTYAELQTAAANWLDRADLTARIPEFIALAEAKMNRRVRVPEMVKRVTAALDAEYEAVPTDFLEAISFRLNTSPPALLSFVTMQQFDAARQDGATGQPTKYTRVGAQLAFHPAPASSYTGELAYYARVPALSGSNTTNVLLTAAPDLYLYGALIEAAPYLRDDDRLPVWGSLYDQAFNDLMDAARKSSFSASPLLVRTSVRF